MKKKSRRDLIVFPSSMLSPKARAVREYMRKHPLPVPPTVRQCAVQGLSSYGFPSIRTSMSPAHARDLVERYPGLYRHADDKPVSSCEPFAREGFACGDGWFTIIDRLSANLTADPNLVVSQLKEKMGLLTVYFDATELASPEIEVATDIALRRACRESKRICEICGAPGAYKKRGHQVSVFCKPCEWLDEIEEACRRLVDCAEGWTSPRSPRGIRLDAARRHVQHVGEAARHQSPERRESLPAVDWERLDVLRRGAPTMAAAEIYRFIRDEVPALVKALQ
jgi:uncharacterized protein with HEPN domain